ncbi:MAG: hypothetical protein U5J62_03805 [Desulfurivibrio sp.]|nr:hypothetical protein [Desulfurivibrio sp.]
MTEIESELAQLAQLLQTVRTVVEPLAGDRRLEQWRQINFDKQGELLAAYGLVADDLRRARDRSAQNITLILKELAKLENEHGDLALDFRRQAIKPPAARARIKQIKEEAAPLETLLLELQEHCRLLFSADEQARRLPTPAGLLPAAKRGTRTDPENLDMGLRFFIFATRDQGKGNSLTAAQGRVIELEGQLRQLDFADLPPMAANLLTHPRQVGLTAADRLKAYIEHFQQQPPAEIKTLKEFQKQLATIRRQPLAPLLEQLPALSMRYSNILLDLYNRSRALRQIELIPACLQKLEQLHTVLQELPSRLRQQLQIPGEPLNPERVAAEHAAEFFVGLRGMMLTFKMLWQSLGGGKVISATELQEKSVEVLNNCPSHIGDSEQSQARQRAFLENQLADYSRPFPFDLLFEHMQKIITLYGGRLEKEIHGYPVPAQPAATTNADENRADTTLARLADKLELWSERF